jgi:tetratricopeptide (TPR) repeat protein
MRGGIWAVVLVAGCCLEPVTAAEKQAAAIPEAAIAELDSALTATKGESSPARQRLALKRVLRDGEKLIEGHPDAANRFEILSILFRGQQALYALDDSPRNREAVLDVAGQLAKAPDDYAALRLDADLLISQAEATREGGDAEARGRALAALVERYRDSPVEGKVLRIAMVMALELGDQPLIDRLRETMAERFATDLDMIAFQREKLGGQVFGVPFAGVFERSDGRMMRFPMDTLGRTVLLVIWSNDEGLDNLKAFATGWREHKDACAGRIEIVSINVDDLPDAGSGLLHDLGVDWPALKLPGGREHPAYRAYARTDPRRVTVSPTGYAAMLMDGTTRKSHDKRSDTGALPDYGRFFGSSLAREWTQPGYVNQIASLAAGTFLVVDPTAPFDPAVPPELRAASFGRSGDERLPRTAASVPVAKLAAIQECFPVPPRSYRMTAADLRARFEKAETLCRETIAAHPQASDLWIVRNRRIVGLLNLWKLESNLARFDDAVAEARRSLETSLPAGADVVPRFCLAREALRRPDADPKQVIDELVRSAGEDSGPALAAAALLALDVADRGLHERYRRAILERHADNPTLWTLTSFLLDRYHRYWLYEAPFTAGWTPERREGYALASGEPEDARRSLEAEFRTLDGQPFRIPQDTSGTWTVLVFSSPWSDPKRAPLPGIVKQIAAFADRRPMKDVRCVVAMLDDDAEKVRGLFDKAPLGCPVVMVPGGIGHPVVARLGILDEHEQANAVVLRPDGTIAAFVRGRPLGNAAENLIEWQDEQAVSAALERGDLEAAKSLAFAIAPPFDPAAKDDKGRPKPKAAISLPHLRSRGRVYAALGQWDAALADAEEVFSQQTAIDGSLSLRSAALDEAERFRDECAAHCAAQKQ